MLKRVKIIPEKDGGLRDTRQEKLERVIGLQPANGKSCQIYQGQLDLQIGFQGSLKVETICPQAAYLVSAFTDSRFARDLPPP